MSRLNPYAKAIVAGLVAAQAATVLAVIDGMITGTEWVLVIFAALTGFGAVWATTNTDVPKVPLSAPTGSADHASSAQ